MNDACDMGHRHRIQHIHHDRYGLLWRHGTVCLEPMVQSGAGYVFKDQIRVLVVNVGFIHGNDIGMFDPAHTARLVQPLRQCARIRTLLGSHDLDGNFALHAGIKRQPDRRLRTATQDFAQFEAPQGIQWTQGPCGQHGLRI